MNLIRAVICLAVAAGGVFLLGWPSVLGNLAVGILAVIAVVWITKNYFVNPRTRIRKVAVICSALLILEGGLAASTLKEVMEGSATSNEEDTQLPVMLEGLGLSEKHESKDLVVDYSHSILAEWERYEDEDASASISYEVLTSKLEWILKKGMNQERTKYDRESVALTKDILEKWNAKEGYLYGYEEEVRGIVLRYEHKLLIIEEQTEFTQDQIKYFIEKLNLTAAE